GRLSLGDRAQARADRPRARSGCCRGSGRVRLPGDAAWPDLLTALDERGYAVLPGLLGRAECGEVAALYDGEEAFRSRVVMARHNFGSGEYKYLRYPLPAPVSGLREALYPRLVPLANQWHERLRLA